MGHLKARPNKTSYLPAFPARQVLLCSAGTKGIKSSPTYGVPKRKRTREAYRTILRASQHHGRR